MRTALYAVTAFVFGLSATPTVAQLAHAQPEWYLRAEGGCRLFVQEYGRGRDTVVVLHGGWGAEHSYLLDAFRGLEDRFHLVFYDQRGSLRSPCPDSLISVDNHIKDLDRVRAALGVERITLFGHSMGTFLATAYLDRYPNRVRGMVLSGATVPRYPPADSAFLALIHAQERAKQAFFRRPEIEAQLREEGLAKDTTQMTDKERTNAWRVRFAGANIYHVERWREMRGGSWGYFKSGAGQAAAKTMPRTWDFTAALRAHSCPVWLIEGDHDFGPLTVEMHRRWIPDFPNARLRVLPSAGHNAWIDAPQEFQRALTEALESTTRCRQS